MKMDIKTLGILGGGQLGRMSALAAAQMGIRVHIYAPEENSPAFEVAHDHVKAKYEDEAALARFAEGVDVISYEFENIPIDTVRFLNSLKPVRPGEKLLSFSQNRLAEKQFLNDIGINTAPWAPAYRAADIENTVSKWEAPAVILKTTRFGYDGKGQLKHSASDQASDSWDKLGGNELIIEGIIDFDYEISVIVARDMFGGTQVYPPVRNEHKNHILDKTYAPGDIPLEIQGKATAMAQKLADAVELVGVVALELFVTKDGQVLANEIAPRTHNSGHWTIDACAVSQFDNHVRCVMGLPVGAPGQHSDALMINLIGEDVQDVPKYLAMANACVHLYGKEEARPGRKMGHVTLLNPDKDLKL